jgi:hypothetical protein
VRFSWINSPDALRERMLVPEQVASVDPEAEMPPYMESLLSHLRLLVGVPFDYLIPDARLLPDESIRFFYVDRSWTDRLVDGALAVGKIGSREQAHHQAHSAPVSQQLDQTERIVRSLQRGRAAFGVLKQQNDANQSPGDVITGFLLRSAVVSGWPHMDVRAYSTDIPEQQLDPSSPTVQASQLTTLRLERLSPAVMLALFQGIPQLVILEEPHHGVQFGVHTSLSGAFQIDLRNQQGQQILDSSDNPIPLTVPTRVANNRVIAVKQLYNALWNAKNSNPTMPNIDGSASFAIEVLNPPWRQRFEGTVDEAGGGSGAFVPFTMVAVRVTDAATLTAVQQLVGV